MNSDPKSFFDEIADDFFAECEELLSNIRRNLLKIDELKTPSTPSNEIMEELLRNFHTLKGLSGMIGAGNILKLTHALENFFKTAKENHSLINREHIDVVITGVRTTEQMLEAVRSKSEFPDTQDLINRIENLKTLGSSKSINTEYGSGNDIKGNNEFFWKFNFTPTKELYEKGININVIRDRITGIGKVKSSQPRALPDGRISFEFIVLTDKPESFFRGWTENGITYEKIETDEKALARSKDDGTQFIKRNVVRVELTKLDDIMTTVGDLVTSRAKLNDYLTSTEKGKSGTADNELHELNTQIDRQLKDLRQGIIKLRLVPVSEAFERLRFIVRDLIRESGKIIKLETAGEETQIDKFVMEKMFDPLLHIVRNAVGHGIENAEERRLAGKPEEGILNLRASSSGDLVIFDITDDGIGIDRERIMEKAIESGMIKKGSLDDDDSILEIMGRHGFSTKEETDLVSGRGVGMNVVMRTINELQGSLSFTSEKGKGTRFTIRLPLTLSIVDALIVTVGKSMFAVPLPAVNGVVRINDSDLITMENNEMLPYRDIVLPMVKLHQFFNIENNRGNIHDAIIIGQGKELSGIIVDKVNGQREIVVRALPDRMVQTAGLSGATELGEGRIILILDPKTLVRSAAKNKHKAYV